MTSIIRPGEAIVFMKIGTHAQESLEAIIQRKLREIDETGMAFWGYGGNTCHPKSMVQPFANEHAASGRPIHLVMQKIVSNHMVTPVPADEFSEDGQQWSAIPNGIEVRGSRFALVIETLQEADLNLPLTRTTVAVGPSRGKSGRGYIGRHVDKACLELGPDVDVPVPEDESTPISLVARLKPPYAVFLRNR